jgi:hypothetical protein
MEYGEHFRGATYRTIYVPFLVAPTLFAPYRLSESQVFDNKTILGIQTFGSPIPTVDPLPTQLPEFITINSVRYAIPYGWYNGVSPAVPPITNGIFLNLVDRHGNVKCRYLPYLSFQQQPGSLFSVRPFLIDGIYTKNCRLYFSQNLVGINAPFVIPITFFYDPKSHHE